jgi:hypothetical protein
MRVIVAGSRKLPPGSSTFAQPLLDVLTGDDLVLLRAPKTGSPGTFEKVIAAYCAYRDVPSRWMRPEPNEENPGRVSVYIRDMDMVAKAESALLFFSPDDVAEGYSGTMHLLDKALDADIKVDAFTVDKEFTVVRFGASDGRIS